MRIQLFRKQKRKNKRERGTIYKYTVLKAKSLMSYCVVSLICAVPQESLIQNAHLWDVVSKYGVCTGCDIKVALNCHVQCIALAA